jgi:transcriptional regulator with XRE-family HTH domain
MRIGARIKQLRESKGMKRPSLAAIIGVDPNTLYRYESGAFGIKDDIKEKIAKALGVPISFLMGETADLSQPTDTKNEMENRNIVGERIKQRRKELKLNQEDSAQKVGVARQTVSSWEKGDFIPEGENLMKLAVALTTNSSYLLGETDDPTPTQKRAQSVESNVAPINPAHMIRVRVLDKFYHACCGTGIDWGGESIEFEQTLLLPLPDLAVRYSDDDVIGVYAEGDSMETLIYDGDLVLFVPHEKSIVYAGVPMVISYNNSMIMRGVIENNHKQLTLRAANKEYRDIIVTPADDFDICGRIVKVFSTREPRAIL